MPAIISVATWRPLPGKIQEFMTVVAAAKKIHERLGGRVRVFTSQFGGVPSTVLYAIEVDSWNAFGAFGEKVSADKEWLALWAAGAASPTAELVSNSTAVEAVV